MISWAKRKFSRRLALAFCLTTLAAVVGSSSLVGRYFQRTLLSEMSQNLQTLAALVEAQIDPDLFERHDAKRLESLAAYLSGKSGARITFIAADGAVIGDSSVNPESLANVENHRERPEVHSALAGTPGGDIRRSRTTGDRFLYAAAPARRNGQVVGVVRAALPLVQIERKVADIRKRTAALSVVVLLAAFAVALALASSMSRPVREMSEVARRIASGDYRSRVADAGEDEHGRLAGALNHLAQRVEQTVQELTRDKAQLSVILSNMTEAVVAVDAGGRIVEINPALARIFSIDPVGSAGKFLLEALRHNQLEELARGILSDRRPRMDEIRIFLPEERVFEAQAAPLFEGDVFAGALIVLHDITRLRRLEQVRRDFVANVSHELRTPLASIKGFAETLEMGALDDPKNAREFLGSIHKQADRMTALVEDLLALAAIESGERRPAIEAVAVAEAIGEVVSGLRPLADRRKLAVKVEVVPGTPPVAADRDQLRQILINLVENALKFTPAGSVTVTAAAVADRVAITVGDTGVGIPAEDLPRIFERFYRVDKARSREMGGTGLGLSIVKHLVEALGGDVAVESSPGKGSRFTVRLPVFVHR